MDYLSCYGGPREPHVYTCPFCGQEHEDHEWPPCWEKTEVEKLWDALHELEARVVRLEVLERSRTEWQRAKGRVEEEQEWKAKRGIP